MDSLHLLWDIILGIFQMYRLVWPVIIFVGITLLFRLGVYLYKRHRYAQAGIADIDKLSGKEFEEYLEVFFQRLGYQVKRTPYQGDYGADLILSKDGVKTAVQAKRYNRSVGLKAVQEIAAAKEYYGCDKAMVVTNSYFSNQAKSLAKATQVELWDREQLVSNLIVSKKSSIASSI